MRKIPLVPVAAGLIAGIAVGHSATAISSSLWLALMALPLLAAAALRIWRQELDSRIFLPLLALLFFALGGTMCRLADPRYDSHHWTSLLNDTSAGDPSAHPHFLALRLKETPVPHERSWRTTAEVMALDGRKTHGEVKLFLRKDSTAANLHYGDSLHLHVYIDSEGMPLYTTGDHLLVSGRDSTSLRARSEAIRMRLLRRMQEGPMERRYSGMAEALTLGWRGDMDKALHLQFRDAGIVHLLCVSGLHVGLLAWIVGTLMIGVGKDRRGRILRGVVQLVTLWGFALLTGLAPATTRAALMFSLFILNHMAGRRTDRLNILALAALVMLTAQPMLLFDVGWQLSFAATAAILLSRPAISLFRNFAWQAAVVSTAATLGTLPITLATFHQLQPYFLLANIVIVPLAALLLAFSLLYLAAPCSLTAWPAEWIFRGCDWLTDGIARLPHAVINDLNPSPLTTALLSGTIIFIWVTINISISRYQKSKNSPPC